MHSLLSLAVGYNTESLPTVDALVTTLWQLSRRIRLPRCSEARCRTPASIMPLAALGGPILQRGPSLCTLGALRRSLSGATMPTPGGAGTRYESCHVTSRARRTGFYHGSELPGATGLRPFALPHSYGARPACPDLHRQWGRHPTVPIPPSVLVSKHIPSVKKSPIQARRNHSFAVYAPTRLGTIMSSLLSRTPLSPSEERPGFSLALPRSDPLRGL
jgi:hypothetical protein